MAAREWGLAWPGVGAEAGRRGVGPGPVPHDEGAPRAHGAAPTAHTHASLLLASRRPPLLPSLNPHPHPHPHPHPTPTQVATGTGIAPYRSFIRRLFVEKTPFAAVRTPMSAP